MDRLKSASWGIRLAGAVICLTSLTSGAALADVLEIAVDGTVTTFAGPSVIAETGVTPILPHPPTRLVAGGTEVSRAINAAADQYALSPTLIEAVAWQESRLRQAVASPKGAVGLMQLMPGTARDLGVDPYDLVQNAFGGTAYLQAMIQRYRGDVVLALAAYNAGPGSVDRYGGVPPFPETQAYVAAILDRLSQMSLPEQVVRARR